MVALGPTVRADAEVLAEAEEVGRETMRRARRNVERLVERLPLAGYVFESAAGLVTFEPPGSDVANRLDRVEEHSGALPLAWRWWSEEVGRVSLTGHHPDWRCDYTDPLVVDAPPEYVESELEQWEQDRESGWAGARPFEIHFSPDLLHKANVSGGSYSVAVPEPSVDGLVLGEPHGTTFVNHLRIAFENGGFGGWARGLCIGPPAELKAIAASLEPL